MSLEQNKDGDFEIGSLSSYPLSLSLLTVTRILDAVEFNGNDVYFAAATYNETQGQVVAFSMGSTSNIQLLSSLNVFDTSSVADVQVASSSSSSSSILYVTTNNGLAKVEFTYVSTSDAYFTALAEYDTGVSGDGLALSSSSTSAYVAAEGDGLVVYDLTDGTLLSQSDDLSGWAGGAAYHDNIALIAADPGLYAFDVTNPAKPLQKWLCSMNGVGWDVSLLLISGDVCYAFVSDYDGGLQVVEFCANSDGPVVVAHYGEGEIKEC
jgi:hypothetical protein